MIMTSGDLISAATVWPFCDQRIMSSPVPSEVEEDKSVTSAKQGKVRQKLQPGRNRDT